MRVLGQNQSSVTVVDDVEVMHVAVVEVRAVDNSLDNLVFVVENETSILIGVYDRHHALALDIGDAEVEALAVVKRWGACSKVD